MFFQFNAVIEQFFTVRGQFNNAHPDCRRNLGNRYGVAFFRVRGAAFKETGVLAVEVAFVKIRDVNRAAVAERKRIGAVLFFIV